MPKLIGKKTIPPQGKWKGIRNKRQGEICRWAKKELYKEQVIPKLDWTDRQPTRQAIESYAESHYQAWKIKKEQRNYLLKETARLYREEIDSKKNQILWYQENAGFTRPNPRKIIKKQKPKLIFPEKGEHKEFFSKKKNFWQILTRKSFTAQRLFN